MAREKDEDPDDALPPIGEGTTDSLEDAKKGKPRSFLLICKGSNVKYLLVKKKPIKPAEITEAKKLGYKGDAFIGVITGNGMQLVFNLASSDGYDSEPCSTKKLKDFLGEHAELKCQPSFAIVATLPEIPSEDDESSRPPAVESPQQSSPSPTVDVALKQKLQDALTKLVPQIKQAVTNFPDRKVEILTPIAEINKQIDAGLLQQAKQGIIEVSQFVKSLQAGPDNQPESAPVTSEIDALRQEYENKLAKLMPQYELALKQQLGDVGKFRAVMAYATEQGEAGGYAKAIKGIDGLAVAIEKAIQAGKKETDVIPENVVDTRKKFLLSRWQQAVQAAYAEIAKIATPIAQLVPEESPTELVDGLTKLLDNFVDEFNASILATQKASSQNYGPLDEAKQAIARFRQQMSSDKLMALFDSAQAQLGIEIQVRYNLTQAIDEIESRLATN